MYTTKVIIAHHQRPSGAFPIISISHALLKKLGIPSDLPLYLHYSNQRLQVTCQVHQAGDNIVYLPIYLAQQLQLAHETKLHLSYQPFTRELRMGPILAILVSQVSIKKPPFADLNQFSEELLQIARKRHIVAYVLSFSELLKETNFVSGWTYTNHGWKQKHFPLPQVLYNRISSRKLEKSKPYQDFLYSLAGKSMFLFNQTFLNKWEVYRLLSREQRFSPYLPKTKMWQGPLTWQTMMQAYPVLFIKPIHGSMGRGIYRISKAWTGYDLRYSSSQGQKQKHFTKLSKLYTFLHNRIKSKRFIIQEGIPLTHLQERPVDFRILMQKNKTGKWAVTSMVARIGSVNRFVSNIARGGEISTIINTLKKCRVNEPFKIKQKLLSVAKLACEIIDHHHSGKFGELGVDLAVTRSGRIYLLELNSKPSKADNTLTIPSPKGRPSVHRLLDYTLFLTKHEQMEV